MKFFTALRLSLNNLMTKKGRTILTSFAGSIGIIGIALILAISTGVQNYISKVEEDTLSSYPITIEESTIDMSSMMQSMMGTGEEQENQDDGKVHSADVMNEMITTLSNKKENNNLAELKKYLDEGNNEITNNSNSIEYGYGLKINLYKENTEDGVIKVNPSTVMNAFGMGEMIEAQNNSSVASMFGSSMMTNTDVWIEMLDNQKLLESQFDLVKGSWPKAYNEVVLILKEDGRIDDYTLYSLGLKDQDELKEKWKAVENGEKIEETDETTSYTYDELLNLSFKLLLNSDYYKKENGLWLNQEDNEDYMKEKIAEAENIKIVGIIKQNEESVASTAVTSGIGYTKQLKEYVIKQSNEAEIVKEQKENKETNVFSGLKFPTEEEKQSYTMSNLTNEQKMAMSRLSSEEIAKMMETYTANKDASYEKNLDKLAAIYVEEPVVRTVDKPSNKKIQNNEEDIGLLARQKELELREKELQLKELELRLMGQVHQKELENKEVAMRNRLKELELQEKEMLLANKALRLQGISSKLKNEVNVKKTVKPVKNSDNKIKETKQIKEIEKNKEVVENTAKKEKTVKKTNDTSRYEGMEVNLLYRYVVSYMKKQGVIDRGVKQDILIKRFGAVNIQKLINKNYLIKLADSTVTCNR